MKKNLFILFLFLSCSSIHAESVYYGFTELSLDESVTYRFVKAMDAESRKAVEDLLGGRKQTEDKSVIKRAQDEWYVRKNYTLPEGNFYESYFYKEDDGDINIILPRITLITEKDFQIDELLKHLGNKVTLGSGKDDYGNRCYFDCQVKTSEEVLDICLFLFDCAFDYGILGVRRFEPDRYWLHPERVIDDNNLYRILTETSLPFVPGHEGEVLIYEADWEGVEYSKWTDSEEDEKNWTWEGTDEGLAITVHTKQGQIWQPQLMVVPDAFLLEVGHDYIVRLTLKVPSDGIYQVNLGSWEANTQYKTSVTACDEWQEIDVKFPKFGWDEGVLYSWEADSQLDLACCHVLLQCGWMVGTTIVKKVQVIEKLKGGETAIKTPKPDKADGAIYNLAGQRVDASYKGIVIQNGKKRIAR